MKVQLRHLLCIASMCAIAKLGSEVWQSPVACWVQSPLDLIVPCAVALVLIVSSVEILRVDVYKERESRLIAVVAWCAVALVVTVTALATVFSALRRMSG
jgi:hypothetical protein